MKGKAYLRNTSVLALFIIIMLSSACPAFAASRYEHGGVELLDETQIPLYEIIKSELPVLPDGNPVPQWIYIQSTKKYLNYRIWNDLGTICYGRYTDVPRNDFKKGTQPPGFPLNPNDGYYLYNGVRGEWRYHGYDVSGNKLSNIYFIPDSVVTKFNEREWIKDPWENLSDTKRTPASIYNDASIYSVYSPDIKASVQNWINKSMKAWAQGDTYGVPLKGNVIDPEVFRYLNVESAPTIQRNGQGRMWHLNRTEWYQTVVVPVQEEKINLPVTADIQCLTPLGEIMDVGKAMDNEDFTVNFIVDGKLHDEGYYDDAVKKTTHYTRNDIKEWRIDFTTPNADGSPGTQTETRIVPSIKSNTIADSFSFNTTYGFMKSHSTFLVTAKVSPIYHDGKSGNTGNASLRVGVEFIPIPDLEAVEIEFTPNHNIPEIAFEGVKFKPTDNTNMSLVKSKSVKVDGVPVDYDYFFSGNYMFPGEVGINGRFAYIDCEYTLEGFPEGYNTAKSRDVVYIYPTKPIANFALTSNTWKQNRLINVQNTSHLANIQLVLSEFPIVEYEWIFGGDTTKLYKGTDTDMLKELMYKEPGVYSLTLRCKNTLGRWSDPYSVTFQVLEDVGPAVGVNLNESVFSRNDTVSAWYYSIVSTDGDVIQHSKIELWYDRDNDGVVEELLQTWENEEQFPDYMPTKLGYYKYKLYAKEDILGDTLIEHITEDDKKASEYEVEFWVDNYQPMADLYINIPIQRPNIDLYIMLDKDLEAEKVEYVKSNRMNISNWLLGKNIIPNVSIWDMKTYTYSQPASTSKNTGGSYPPSTLEYSSNGYSGTLNRTSVSNNPYTRDEGHYENKTETKTVSQSASNTTWEKYRHNGSHWVRVDYNNSQLPDTRSYSDSAGFSGTLYKGAGTLVSQTGSPPSNPTEGSTYTITRKWSCTYSGTVSRTIQVWVPNIVSYNSYTGHYSGTIYKDIRQSYTDTFNPTSLKYIIYISDSSVSEPKDLNLVRGYAKTAKLYLAGTEDILAAAEHDKYFDLSGRAIDSVIDEILRDIAENSPAVEKYYSLQNEEFKLNVGQMDLENDSIIEEAMQYVHEPGYYDNPTGMEPGTVEQFSEDVGWTTAIKNKLANTGKYTIYRRVKDNPSTDPNFSQYSYYSGLTSLEIYVVRKPIALASLDWDFDIDTNTYKTTWVDMSYDPDHEFSREDKGIVGRTIMWRKSGSEWNYGIPDNLSAGTYELNYYVLDPEGYWSEPFIMNFTLTDAPPIQFEAFLRPLMQEKFSLLRIEGSVENPGIPSSEVLEAFGLWTRYPKDVHLEMALYNSANKRVSTVKTVHFDTVKGTKRGNDISWNNVTYQIPETLPDGSYEFRISAVSENGVSATKSFSVDVFTPIDLVPIIPPEAVAGTYVDVGARTSKYAEELVVTLFHELGGVYQLTSRLNGEYNTGDKVWEGNIEIPGNVPEGDYYAKFIATTPNGKSITEYAPFKLTNLGIASVTLSGYWNHWRGQVDIFGEQLTNEPHRFLSLECVKVNIATVGNPERVSIRFSPELEAMQYTDPNGHTYYYDKDFFGYKVEFPKDSTFFLSGNHVYWEYNLPLAPSTKDWNNVRLKPPYKMIVTAYKGDSTVQYIIDDIDITGNIYDLTYIQPKS